MGASNDLGRAEFTISSQPPDAIVYRASDGKELGKTPMTLSLIRSPLDYNVRIHRDGFFDYPLTLKPRMSSNMPITMNPIPKGFDRSKLPPEMRNGQGPSGGAKPDADAKAAQEAADAKAAQEAADAKAAQEAADAKAAAAAKSSGSSKSSSKPKSSGKSKTSKKPAANTQWTVPDVYVPTQQNNQQRTQPATTKRRF